MQNVKIETAYTPYPMPRIVFLGVDADEIKNSENAIVAIKQLAENQGHERTSTIRVLVPS
jgi:hypothetical protein